MIERKCKNCEKTFYVFPTRLKASSCEYCSNKCRAEDWRGNNNPNWKGGLLTRSCVKCGKIFLTKAKNVRNGYGNYCSRKCVSTKIAESTKAKWNPLRTQKECVVCGKVVLIKKSHETTEGTYCSKGCMSVGYSERFKFDANPNYKHGEFVGKHGGKRRRRLIKLVGGSHSLKDVLDILKFQKYKCVVCKTDIKNKYEIDHIVPISKMGTNNKENLQMLCTKCNREKSAKDPILFMQSKGFLL